MPHPAPKRMRRRGPSARRRWSMRDGGLHGGTPWKLKVRAGARQAATIHEYLSQHGHVDAQGAGKWWRQALGGLCEHLRRSENAAEMSWRSSDLRQARSFVNMPGLSAMLIASRDGSKTCRQDSPLLDVPWQVLRAPRHAACRSRQSSFTRDPVPMGHDCITPSDFLLAQTMCRLGAAIPEDHFRRLLGDHDDRRVGVA